MIDEDDPWTGPVIGTVVAFDSVDVDAEWQRRESAEEAVELAFAELTKNRHPVHVRIMRELADAIIQRLHPEREKP